MIEKWDNKEIDQEIIEDQINIIEMRITIETTIIIEEEIIIIIGIRIIDRIIHISKEDITTIDSIKEGIKISNATTIKTKTNIRININNKITIKDQIIKCNSNTIKTILIDIQIIIQTIIINPPITIITITMDLHIEEIIDLNTYLES